VAKRYGIKMKTKLRRNATHLGVIEAGEVLEKEIGAAALRRAAKLRSRSVAALRERGEGGEVCGRRRGSGGGGFYR
jgi:hypothetical protein